MLQSQAHYFLSPVLVYDGPELKVAMTRALVSPTGVYKVFEESEEVRKAFLSARVFQARLDGLDYRARLVRESGPCGTHYNLHLLEPELEQPEHLRGLLQRYGFASPWKRDFARIPTGPRGAEVPATAILTRFSGRATASVRNFSYHGLFVQLQCGCPSIGESVGQTLRFRLVTSRGRLLEDASGRIARIYDEMVAPGKLHRGLGLRILEMPSAAESAYHGMILESCRELQGEAREE